MLETDSKAIDLTLPNEHGNPVALHDFREKKVVLYFYPKDNTSGYIRQACAFKVVYEEFKRRDIVVIGISKDSSASHIRFREKYELPLLLLSDTELSVTQAYDVWKGKKLYRKTYMGVAHSTYVTDEGGIIIKTLEKASSVNNVAGILQYVKDIRQISLYTLLRTQKKAAVCCVFLRSRSGEISNHKLGNLLFSVLFADEVQLFS